MTANNTQAPTQPVIAPRKVYVNFYAGDVGGSQCYRTPERAKSAALGGPTETAVEFEEVTLQLPSAQPVIAPAQPVAWIQDGMAILRHGDDSAEHWIAAGWKPLYAAPPQPVIAPTQAQPMAWSVPHPVDGRPMLYVIEESAKREASSRMNRVAVTPLYAAPQPVIAPSLPDAQPANWRLK